MANGKFQEWVDNELVDAVIAGAERMYLTQSSASKRTSLNDVKAWVLDGIATNPTVFYPEDYAAVGYTYTKVSSSGEYLGSGLFRDLAQPFTAADVGATFHQDSSTTRTITAVDGAGVATISPAPYGTTDITYISYKYDWTAAIQAAWDAAAAVADYSLVSNTGSYGPVTMGGIVVLQANKKYGVFNSSASFSGGKRSCLTIRRRTSFSTAFAINESMACIVQLPKSYGHIFATENDTDYIDFVTMANFGIEGMADFSPNGQRGIHFVVPTGSFSRVDAFNRFERITIRRTKTDGGYFSGRGEIKFRDVDCFDCGNNGLFLYNQYDWSLIGGQFGGNDWAGLYVDRSGAGNATGFKSFYSGSGGGSDPKKCANVVITGDQMRAGFVWMSNFQAQESRGSAIYVDVGNCYLDNFQALDPSRTALIASGTLPTIRAGLHVTGEGARMNSFYGTVSPSVAVYSGTNWNADTYSVYVDDVDVNGAGPQLNEGRIKTYRATINTGGGTQVGTQYSGTGTVKGGGGVTNGKNPDLYIDGVACAALLGAAPASGDLVEIVDVSDTTASASGTKKLVAYSDFAGSGSAFSAITGGTNTTAAMVVGTGASLAASGSGTITATTVTGASTITSNSANALAVGPNGATNPALKVNGSIASSATGWDVVPNSGAAIRLNAISSAADCEAVIASKGTGAATLAGGNFVTLQLNGNNVFSSSQNSMQMNPLTGQRAFTSNVAFRFINVASTSIPASTDTPSAFFDFGQIQQHSTGALTLQQDFRIRPSTHSFVAASTATDLTGLTVDGAPIAGTNATVTNSSAIYSAGSAVGAATTNSYGLNITANTGATNNYCVRYAGTAGEIYRVRTDGQIAFLATNTAGGTTGARTINQPSGTVNFAAAATSLVVTNSLCTTSSIVFATVRTNDATAVIKNVVPAAGSFTITLNAAATAETSVGFFIIN